MSKCNNIAAILGIAAAGTIGSMASASPGFGVTSENLVTADYADVGHFNHDLIKFQTKDPTIVRVQKLTFAAGSYSGWHHHPGVIIVAVASGSVTLSHADCSSKAYGPGSANGAVFVEGSDGAQEARSAAGAVVYVTYVVPSASPPVFRIEDNPPLCAPSF